MTISDPPPNSPRISMPSRRKLRAFAFDPMTSRLTGRFVSLDVRFEKGLQPGPVGELLEVLDYDASRDVWYSPVDLDDPAILAMGGLQPSESDPRTHQQVVYAVAMSVIERFERFGGRRFRWLRNERLRLLPHAFEEANAYFDPTRKAVLFGYYSADATDPGPNLPQQTEYTCLSVDIVAHEVTHAIVHRLRRHFSEPTNVDVFAWHEAFADLVALFHHFVFPDAVSRALANSGGDLGVEKGNALLKLAHEFGRATGRGAALRSAIGSDRTPDAFRNAREPHERGACFVAAVFDAFLDTYQTQIADLRRLATGGSGVLPAGALHPDLVNRLTVEALRNADRVLGMVVRAFEFLPVVDVTFGDVVRAIVTADRMLFPEDALQLRSNLVEALRQRGIVPAGVSSLSEDALPWTQPENLTLADGDIDLSELILGASMDLDLEGTASDLGKGDDSREGSDGDEYGPDGDGAGGADQNETPSLSSGPPPQVPGGGNSRGTELWYALHKWAVAHAPVLGLDPSLEIALIGGHVSYLQGADGQPHPIVVLQYTQRHPELEDTSVPERQRVAMRSGTTVIARVDGTVTSIVAKPLPVADRTALNGLSPDDAKVAAAYDVAGTERLAGMREWFGEVEASDSLAAWITEPAVHRLTFARLHAAETVKGS